MKIHLTRPILASIMVVCLFLLVTLAGCYPSVNPADMQAAKTGVETALAQIPSPDFVTVIRVIPDYHDDSQYLNWGDQVCAYGTMWIIIVSSRPQDEVVKAYVTQLETIGFQLKGHQYAHAATLYRGERDRADIDSLPDGAWYSSHAEYQQLHQAYTSVMELAIETVVPDRQTCIRWSQDDLSAPYAVPTVTPTSSSKP